MATKSTQVNVTLSNSTDNQTSINSTDGHNVTSGDNQNVSGQEMNIRGVSSGAKVSADVGENYTNISLDSAWNSVKNVEISSEEAADVQVDNFVHADVDLGGEGDSDVGVTGAKRGNISTGNGNDNISVDAQSNGSGWSNQFNINSGNGADTITLNGDGGFTFFEVNTGFGSDTVTMVGDDYASSRVNLGEGNDVFVGGRGQDRVESATGDNRISTGDGEDILITGLGNDILDGGIGDDRISSGNGDDTVVYDENDSYIDGGLGNDTLVVDGNLNVDTNQVRGFENIELTDGAADDSVSITMEQARTLSDSNVVKITGDAGDQVETFAFSSQLDDVNEGDVTFSVYEGTQGEEIWVQHGMLLGESIVGEQPPVVATLEAEPEPFEMVFVGEGAGYKNTIGYYVVDENGDIKDVNVNFENASAHNSGGDLISNQSTSAIDVPEGSHVEFFLIANGFNANRQFRDIDSEEGEFNFVNHNGEGASVFDGGIPSLTFTSADGSVTTLKGDIYHTNHTGFSADGHDHAVIEPSADGSSVKISFEDLKNLGDRDFNDLVVEVNIGGFNGNVAGTDAGTGPINAPVAVDDGIEQFVVLGSKENAGSMEDWGTVNEDGSVSFDKGGVSGTVQALNRNGDNADVEYSVGNSGGGRNDFGLGVDGRGSAEVDLNESLVVNFDNVAQGARVGFDSLFGHFNEGSRQDARVSWKAYEDGELVAEGEVINDKNNVDGDGKRETNFVDIEQSFDSLVFETVSPTSNSNSNFVLRYIEVNTGEGLPVEEGEPLILSAEQLLENDFDIDGDELNITSVEDTSVNGGSIQFDAESGEVIYTSAEGFAGKDTFTYTISDGNGGESTATVHVLVKAGESSGPVNEVPVAVNDVVTTEEDTAVSVNVTELLENDSDVDGDALTVLSVGTASVNGGVVEFNADTGEVTYTPADNFSGEDSFTYTISDGQGGESTASVNVTVNPVYDTPEAQNITATAVEDGNAVVLDASVLNVEGSQLFYSLASTTDEGRVVNNGDGTFTFNVDRAFQDLDSGETREVQFTYQITDLGGNSSTAEAVVTVAGLNDAPTAVNNSFTFSEDDVRAVNGTYNVADVDGEPLTIQLLGQLNAATEGTVTDNGDGTFGFTPATNPDAYAYLSGGEQLTFEVEYSVTDGDETTTASVQFTINGIEDPTVVEEIIIGAEDDDVVTDDGEPIVIDIIGAVNDPDSPVTISVPNPPNPETEGDLIDNGDGTYTFEPSPELDALDDGETQEIVFEYVVTDDEGNETTQTVTIIVTGTNDTPVAEDVTISTDEDNSATASFVATDVDANDVLTYTVVDAPDPETEGSVVVNGDQFTFNPADSLNSLALGESVDVTFRYRASDGDAADFAHVTVTVVGTNDRPEIGDISIGAFESQASQQLDISPFISDVDSDDDASTLNYSFAQPSQGELVDLGGGVLEFRTNGAFENLAEGEVLFMEVALTVQDSHGAVVVKNMQIAVTGENDAPVAEVVSVNVSEDASMNFALSISDIDGDNLTVTFIDPPAELNISATGVNASVTPTALLQSLDDGEVAVFNVTYTVSDGIETVQNVATITVQGNNDVPVIESIQLSMLEDSISVTQAFGGTDIENDQIIYLIQNPPVDSDGFVTIDNINGEFTFTAGAGLDSMQAGETKVIQFSYVATDGKDTSNPQVVQITIQGQNDAPVILAVNETMGEDDGTQIFSLNVSDVDNAISELTFNLDVEPTNASVVLNADGTFSVTPGTELQALNDGETALIEFTYSVSDGDNVVSQTARVNVVGSTDMPVVNSVFFEDPLQVVERFQYNFDINDAFANLLGGETVTFSDEFGGAAPNFIRYDAQLGQVILLTSVNDFGEYTIQIHLTDSSGTNITQQFKVFVSELGTSLDTNSIITGSENDVISGTALGEYISSGNGADTVIAGDGNDTIFGGAGNDHLVGGDGNDIFLLGGAFVEDGLDTFRGGEGYDSIVFHSGGSRTMFVDGTFDSLSSIEEIRSVTDGIGSIRGLGNNDVIDLSTVHLEGTFRIFAGSGNDIVTGSAGDDAFIYGQAGNDTLDGYLGNDTLRGDAGNDTLYGGEGDDHLTGGTGVDSLYGGAGNDVLVWDADDAVLDGGVGGFDILDLTGQTSVDFTTEPANEVGFEAIDMSGSATDITLGLADVLEIRDTSIDTLYIMANNGDNVTVNGEFEVTAQIDVVDTNGDGSTDSTFQVYRSTLHSDVFIGLELGVGLSLDGTLV